MTVYHRLQFAQFICLSLLRTAAAELIVEAGSFRAAVGSLLVPAQTYAYVCFHVVILYVYTQIRGAEHPPLDAKQ